MTETYFCVICEHRYGVPSDAFEDDPPMTIRAVCPLCKNHDGPDGPETLHLHQPSYQAHVVEPLEEGQHGFQGKA